jgi:hypothetical protein
MSLLQKLAHLRFNYHVLPASFYLRGARHLRNNTSDATVREFLTAHIEGGELVMQLYEMNRDSIFSMEKTTYVAYKTMFQVFGEMFRNELNAAMEPDEFLRYYYQKAMDNC